MADGDCVEYSESFRQAAVPYSQLKKCLKSIQRELKDLGLDPDTLHQLLAAQTPSLEPFAKYKIEGEYCPRVAIRVPPNLTDPSRRDRNSETKTHRSGRHRGRRCCRC